MLVRVCQPILVFTLSVNWSPNRIKTGLVEGGSFSPSIKIKILQYNFQGSLLSHEYYQCSAVEYLNFSQERNIIHKAQERRLNFEIKGVKKHTNLVWSKTLKQKKPKVVNTRISS